MTTPSPRRPISRFAVQVASLAIAVLGTAALGGGDCDPWQLVDAPPDDGAHLWGVRAIGPNDVWAVGHEEVYYSPYSYDSHSLTIHWDGTSFTRIPSPTPGIYTGGGTQVSLRDVGGAAGDDVWAVGSYKIQHPQDNFVGFQTIAMHWDGSSWEQVETPVTVVTTTGASLDALAVRSSDDVYAVGWRTDPTSGDQVEWIGHVLRWNGASWTPLPDPPIAGRRHNLRDVAVIDDETIIAVGGHSGQTYGARDQPYVLTWDGSWELVDVPVPPGQNFLQSVAVVAPDDIWIAGKNDPIDAPWRPLFLHYDGSAWSIVDDFAFAPYGGGLFSITAAGPDELYASGNKAQTQGDFNRHLLMRYDGTTWSEVDLEQTPFGGTLFAIDAIAPCTAWAAGIGASGGTVHQLPGGGETSARDERRPGDVNGDDAIDVGDLVAVISAWGDCAAHSPDCPADIAPAPGGDGAVDVDDLVMVMTHWD